LIASAAGAIPRTVAYYEEFFSWASRHHCLWKSAPVDLLLFLIYLFLAISAEPIMSKSTGPIDAKFAGFVELRL